jgi:hypothetical protein
VRKEFHGAFDATRTRAVSGFHYEFSSNALYHRADSVNCGKQDFL